jgi:hypothetical protein
MEFKKVWEIINILKKYDSGLKTIKFNDLSVSIKETAGVINENYQSILNIIKIVEKNHSDIIYAIKVIYPVVIEIIEVLKEEEQIDKES